MSESFLFRGLPEDQLKEIERIAVNRNFVKREAIFSEGEDADGFYLVAKGLVKIFKVSSEGKEQILHIFGPGEPFAEVPVFSGQKFPANAEAIKKSELVFFQKTSFVRLISSNPSLALNMLAVLSLRLRQFTVQVENLSLKEVPGRLAAYLIYLSEEQDKRDFVVLNISKGQLASLLGTIPETLSRIFSKMTSQNLIEVRDRTIALLDRIGLEELAEHGKRLE
jgi:CRP/FNR family transcriptional regulator